MRKTKNIVVIILGIILISGSLAHLLTPSISDKLIPSILPKTPVHIVIFILELGLGIGVLIQKYKRKALLGILLLMIVFLPIHIFDLTRETPVIGSVTIAIIRILIQFLLIFMAWFALKKK